jgi:AcrR family transcriptional regulator
MPVLDLASGGAALSGDSLAELADLQLETWAQTAPQAQVFWSELIQASAIQPAIALALAPWIAQQQAFWRHLAEATHCGDHAALIAQALFGFSIDERAHGTALQSIPAYRRLRRLCLVRLCHLDFAGRGRDDQRAIFGHLVARLGDFDDTIRIDRDDAAPAGIKDVGLAVVAARVLVCEGASELTHRAVAARANVPTSTLAYHFRTREDLLKGAMQAIILSLKNAMFVRDADPLFADGEAPGYLIARSTFALALEASRTPHLVASAADMRRKRGVNLVHHLNAGLPRDRQVDALGAQVLSVAVTGQMMVDASRGIEVVAQVSNTLIERLLAA